MTPEQNQVGPETDEVVRRLSATLDVSPTRIRTALAELVRRGLIQVPAISKAHGGQDV